MAGQGTVALELIEEIGPLGALLVPIGGGGLIAGCATAATALSPGIRVIGVEPAAGDDTARSLAAGERVEIDVPRTIADGQAISTPGELTFAINRRLVDGVELVSDDEIRAAMAFAFERLKIVARAEWRERAGGVAGRADPRTCRSASESCCQAGTSAWTGSSSCSAEAELAGLRAP